MFFLKVSIITHNPKRLPYNLLRFELISISHGLEVSIEFKMHLNRQLMERALGTKTKLWIWKKVLPTRKRGTRARATPVIKFCVERFQNRCQHEQNFVRKLFFGNFLATTYFKHAKLHSHLRSRKRTSELIGSQVCLNRCTTVHFIRKLGVPHSWIRFRTCLMLKHKQTEIR